MRVGMAGRSMLLWMVVRAVDMDGWDGELDTGGVWDGYICALYRDIGDRHGMAIGDIRNIFAGTRSIVMDKGCCLLRRPSHDGFLRDRSQMAYNAFLTKSFPTIACSC